MKKLMAIVILTGFVFAGCASYQPMGVIYTKVDAGIASADGPVGYTKVGKSEASSVLGLVATGDASIQTAVKNGGIKSIKYVDYHVENILGVIGKYTTTVYGD
ncbi:MAG: TRL-like family protein [Deltaproteobacteria bacterium]|nr:TRL-like family protein [Deltaproteobacteria bacterium]